ncbi:hypothetical protein [Rheinheimera sp. MMS21-TC3]|uniref:hypothetical protein n=1 Tax=Rheinheimera sp. MMS21-TC3 TaxID=3072790 RepID=UPI0028C48D03|nr:hypothetical protein [Rheinheimera sp. MMS21-TC3]WNO60426.1 hypothetical protein RDV63_05530 [Rheinheimera sp. MMS21-TC3]
MKVPEQHLIDECDIEVQKYIDYLSVSNASLRGDLLRLDGKIQSMANDYNLLENDLKVKSSCLLNEIAARDALSKLIKSMCSTPLTSDGIRSAIVGLPDRPEDINEKSDHVQEYVRSVETLVEFLLNHIEKLDALDLRNKKSQLDQFAMASIAVAHEQVQVLPQATLKRMIGKGDSALPITGKNVRQAVAITAYMMAEAMQAESHKRQGGAA